MLLNCGVGEDSSESLDSKEIQPAYPKGNHGRKQRRTKEPLDESERGQ